ncbi:hypothetical protein ATX44_12200 [Oenococcus oeni]|nr:hypothetical protein ATX44_12200 [Oenococcus oeni]
MEDVLNVIDLEKPIGVVVQFGGQTAINLAGRLENNGVKLLGTSLKDINRSEDREDFNQVIKKLDLSQPFGKTATTVTQALSVAEEVGYPLLIRPSYVLGRSGNGNCDKSPRSIRLYEKSCESFFKTSGFN